jgi:hypothetical protein
MNILLFFIISQIAGGIPPLIKGRSFGFRRSNRLEDNVKIDVREIGWEDVDWIHLARYKD